MTTANVNITKVLLKRGNTVQNNNYTGVFGEITIDTQLKTLRIHDGVTAGGNAITASGAIGSYSNTNTAAYLASQSITSANIGAFQTFANANAATQTTEINSLRSNVTAANAAITALQSNAAIQATLLDTLTGNAATQSQVLDTLTSNAAAQATSLTTLLSNAVAQQTSLIDLVANAATQAQAIASVTGTYSNANVATYLSVFDGNILPSANVTYSLGSETRQWRDLWVSNNTIYIGNTPIRVDGGTLLVNNAPVTAGSTYSNANVASYLPTYSGNIAANIVKNGHTWNFGTDGTTTLPTVLAGDTSIGTAFNTNPPGHTLTLKHNGGTGGGSGNEIKFDYGNTKIKVVKDAGTTQIWEFNSDGNLTLPAGGTITEGGGISGAIRLTPAGGANANQALLIYPTGNAEGDHVHLTAAGGSTELYLGNDFHYVKLVDGGNIELRATTANLSSQAAWTFDTTGNIDAIQALGIKVPNGVPTDVAVINSTTGSWEMNPRSDLATTGGTGTGLLVNVTETGGYASTIAIAEIAGTGYTNGDVITVTSGTSSATFTIVIGGRNTWQFGTDRALTLPSGTSNIQSVQQNGYQSKVTVSPFRILSQARRSQSQSYSSANEDFTSAASDGNGMIAFVGLQGGVAEFIIDTMDNGGVYERTVRLNGTGPEYGYNSFNDTDDQVFLNIAAPAGAVTSIRFSYTRISKIDIEPDEGVFRIESEPSQDIDIQSGQELRLIATDRVDIDTGTNMRLRAGDGSVQITTNFQVPGATTHQWEFTNGGRLLLPNNTTLKDTANSSVAFGYEAGLNSQGGQAVAIGIESGYTSQGNNAVAVGSYAGGTTQGTYAVAVGAQAGSATQGAGAVAVGLQAGQNGQGGGAVAIGAGAGLIDQNGSAVAIGYAAGETTQGVYAVAIGSSAGRTSQSNYSIILNATGANLNATTANTFTVAPVRNDVANVGQVMFYNTTSKEVTYGNTISIAGNINASQFNFANGVNIFDTITGVTSISTSVSTLTVSDASGDFTYGALSYDYAVNGNAGQFSIEYSAPLAFGNVDINVGNVTATGTANVANLTTTGNITAGNVSASQYNFANGVNILSTVGAGGTTDRLTNGGSEVALQANGVTTFGNTATISNNGGEFRLWADNDISVYRNGRDGYGVTENEVKVFADNTQITATTPNGLEIKQGNLIIPNDKAVVFANGVNILSTVGAGSYGNAEVAAYLLNFDGDIEFTSSTAKIGNVDVITVMDSIRSPAYQFSNGTSIFSGITGTYSNTNVASYLTTATITTTGNITAGNLITTGAYGNITGANVISATTISATNYLFANGVNILSTVGAGSYGNTEVAAYLMTWPNADINILDATSANITTLRAANFNSANAVISGGYISTLTNASIITSTVVTQNITNGNVTTLRATNFGTANAVISGGYISALTNASIITSTVVTENITNGNITTLVAANFSTANAVISGGYIANTANITVASGGNIAGVGNIIGSTANTTITAEAFTTSFLSNGVMITSTIIQTDAYYETYSNVTNTGGNITFNFANTTVFYATLTANVTANITNLANNLSTVTGFTVIIDQGATPYRIANIQFDGGTVTNIRWAGTTVPTGTASNTDIVSISLVNLGNGSYRVLGQQSSYG